MFRHDTKYDKEQFDKYKLLSGYSQDEAFIVNALLHEHQIHQNMQKKIAILKLANEHSRLSLQLTEYDLRFAIERKRRTQNDGNVLRECECFYTI